MPPDDLSFLAGTYRSHLGRVALGLADLLAADAKLNVWCGGVASPFSRGRIHLPVHIYDRPEGDTPMLLVYTLAEIPDPKPNRVMDITGSVVVTALWDDERVILDDASIGPETLAAYIRHVAVKDDAAYHLKVPRYSNRPLVNSISSFGQARIGPEMTKEQLGRIFSEEPEDELRDQQPSGLQLDLQIDYRYQVDRDTWTPAGFTPAE